ncbi:hypothetical protein CQW23_07033 [Capsicum baccatum]|uniref:Uncharacterized protein n=1 Tax=Capsicum baccatum TaxID=33114 RepID=A0A2G2X527_CAPBA|nr:hypothetical protein CQW23_07033 [Capsicum baccatum]
MLHCVKLVVVDKVSVVGEVKLAMWKPHCFPINRLLLQADELIPMDSTVRGYATTSLFSKAVWVSINPLLSTGYQSPLKLDEVPLLPPDFQAVVFPYKSDIPRAVWNPPLTRRGSPQPKCAARVVVSESDTPQDI